MAEQRPFYPRPPAHLARYVEALGPEKAIGFFQEFGGAELYIAQAPTSRSELVEVMGISAARALAKVADHLPARVPTAKRWLAQCYFAKGLSKARIARKLGVTDVTVRSYLKGQTPSNYTQPDLFD